MSESGDFDPGPWRGHDFGDAYKHYDRHVGRSYVEARSESRPKVSVLEATIATKSKNPLIIVQDVTGSMDEWPKVIFSKLPYLELEAREYLGNDLEIAFGAFGDAMANDTYPAQMRPFTSGTDLKTRMEELVIEKKGGDGLSESAELMALYCLHNVIMENAVRPVLIIITDEKPYTAISVDQAAVVGVKLDKRTTTKDVFRKLCLKFSVYLVRKPYGRGWDRNAMSEEDKEVKTAWLELLDADHICDLPDPSRVVDVIFGILANETGRDEYFRTELEGRQKDEQVKTVYRSLASIHDASASAAKRSGASVMRSLDTNRPGKRSKKLL